MLLPHGRPLHENMGIAYTQFDGMVADLKSNRFSGYLRLANGEREGVLFFDKGNMVGAIDELNGKRRSGFVAAQAIATLGEGKTGTISIYQLPEEIVSLLAGMGQGESIYGNLTSDLTDLEKLIAKLASDKHIGYIEVRVNDAKGTGLVFLQPGNPIKGMFETGDQIIDGDETVSQMIGVITKFGASFNVYSSVRGTMTQNPVMIHRGLELPRLLAVWEEIITTVESTVDGLSTKGQFITAFKQTLSEKVYDYPSLSPISGEFQYKDGHTSFVGESCENLSEGLGVCLSATVTKLEVKSPKANLMVRTKMALEQVRQNQAEAFEKFALETHLDVLNLSLYERVIAEALPFLGNNTTAFIERQCREHLGIIPPALESERLGSLAHRLEISAALLIPREKAQELRQKIEALA